MKINSLRFIIIYLCVMFFSLSACASKETTYNCEADPSWFTSPSMPIEVAQSNKDGSSNFCDFYQFSWQAFAYLMSPSTADRSIRNFQNIAAYPELEINSDGSPANSCDEDHSSNTLFVRLNKTEGAHGDFQIPERINQAGGGATIYDQSRNVVYYDVRFSKNMCNVPDIVKQNNFPEGTTELKTAWKVLTESDNKNDYLTMNTTIGTDSKTTTLGMIGFHIAAATTNHPEFVWATFEHNRNAPNCSSQARSTNWSFASQQCTADLENKNVLGIVQCRFNTASKQTNLSAVTGNPTEICREYSYGSAQGDLKYEENVGDITSLNRNVQAYLTGPYKVLSNYFNVGALWVSNIQQDSDIKNQRGSLRLANTVAETVHQNVDLSASFISNCFGCHNYSASSSNTTSGGLSHILDDIAIGNGQCFDLKSSQLINNQEQANKLCPKACSDFSSSFTWNGQWTNQGVPMTVCGCCVKKQQ